MFSKRKNKHSGKINSLIGKGTKIIGNIDFSGGLHIDGQVCGNITAKDDDMASITVSEFAHILGEIHIPNIKINGVIEGDIYSSNHLELDSKAQIKGNIYYNVLEMAVGSEINGSLEHGMTKIEAVENIAHNKEKPIPRLNKSGTSNANTSKSEK